MQVNETGEDRRGLVQVYTGNGKGKTTAAIGLAIRAAGRGFRVFIMQFLKGRDTGELHTLARLDSQVEVVQVGAGQFYYPGRPNPELEEKTREALLRAQLVVESGKYDLVILDEILVAVKLGLAPEQDVLQLIRDKPKQVELVLTGRDASPAIEAAADLVTYMTEVKHPFQSGIPARRGIEY